MKLEAMMQIFSTADNGPQPPASTSVKCPNNTQTQDVTKTGRNSTVAVSSGILSVAQKALLVACLVTGSVSSGFAQSCAEMSYDRAQTRLEIITTIASDPLAAAGVAGTIGGLKAFFNQELSDDQRQIFEFGGFLGGMYCLGHGNECTSMVVRLTPLLMKLSQSNDLISANDCDP